MIIVSNRLPVSVTRTGKQVSIANSGGGLVRALEQALGRQHALWVGWPGVELDPEVTAAIEQHSRGATIRLEPIPLSKWETDNFYNGFSNEIVWPLFHDLQSRCNFDPAYWDVYLSVNQKFADRIVDLSPLSDVIWVHDYHLVHLGRFLRERKVESRLAFFLHIPFPPHDIFEKLPWSRDFLLALLRYDVLGFQTDRDLRNFLDCLRMALPEANVMQPDPDQVQIDFAHQLTTAASFPISIDFTAMAEQAASPEVTERVLELRRRLPASVALGIDRLDYTKGIPERLKAFRHLLATEPRLHGGICLLQVVVPSRESVPRYQKLRLQIERLVGAINGEFATPGWTPVQYLYRSLETEELLAYYRAADIAFITPLKDGMNLVAKEYCAAQVDSDGVIVLSKFAGAAAQMRSGALLVNPYDTVGMAKALSRAIAMPKEERRFRMRRLRANLRQSDVHAWMQSFQATVARIGVASAAVGHSISASA